MVLPKSWSAHLTVKQDNFMSEGNVNRILQISLQGGVNFFQQKCNERVLL